MHVIKNTFKKVALGISGGVDSAVAAVLLKKQGFEVTGVFMNNWDINEESGSCSASFDVEDAEWVCSKLGIPFRVANFVKDYWHNVFVKFVEDYVRGFTPNPDVLCNKHIKFSKFTEFSLNFLNCDAISTGHYANSSFGNYLEYYDEKGFVQLLKAKDSKKDQTFFLGAISQEALRKTMFPLGNLTKPKVKQIAEQNMLHRVLKKRESVGICFIGSRNFKDFISGYVPSCDGKVINVDSGKQVSSHSGVHHWAIGERFKLAGNPKRTYIVKKDATTQNIYVACGQDHPALYVVGLETFSPHWIGHIPEQLQGLNSSVYECCFRFQHTHPVRTCSLMRASDQGLIVNLKEPLCSVSPGQYVVFYKDNVCLGSAQIRCTGPSLFTLNGIV